MGAGLNTDVGGSDGAGDSDGPEPLPPLTINLKTLACNHSGWNTISTECFHTPLFTLICNSTVWLKKSTSPALMAVITASPGLSTVTIPVLLTETASPEATSN